MNAVMQDQPVNAPLQVHESRDFRSYQAWLRAARNFAEQQLVPQMYDQYQRQLAAAPGAAPRNADDADALLAPLTEFQLYNYFYRHLQRFKYHRPSLGIFATLQSQRERLAAGLESAKRRAEPNELRLNPELRLPDYFRYVPFHQHTGGVTHDLLDGMAYEIGRRTTVPSHADPNNIYRLLFGALPPGNYRRVLDWGTGHGAALITWKLMHPDSECYGVDLSEPCLLIAHQRTREQNLVCHFSQQDLECMDFPDGHFDLIFYNFMLHELPPANTPALFREAARVLRPGGLFAGHEFHLRPGDAFQNALQRSHAFTNNESYSAPWYHTPVDEIARNAGFSRVTITPFERLNRSVLRPGKEPVNVNHWNLYLCEK
jgi:SAM-dependent methyltransferase